MAEESTRNVETSLTQSAGLSAADNHADNETTALPSNEQASAETTTSTAANTTLDTKSDSKTEGVASGGGPSGNGNESENASPKSSDIPATTDGNQSEGSGALVSRSASPAKQEVDSAGKPAVSAAKKPISFKAVSINKKYLEKAANSSPTLSSSKLSLSLDKGASSTTPSSASNALKAKTRLVNKNVGVLQTSKLASASGAKEQGVWTKNQPPPVVDSSKMTDEELKKTYGIHLTSRMKSDEGSKEPKWGDEDDDDDWVPEVPAEWAKTLASAEKAASQAETPATQPAKTPEPEKPAIKEPPKDASSSSSLKPAAPPSKSPWAPLPPVTTTLPSPAVSSPSQQYREPYRSYDRDSHRSFERSQDRRVGPSPGAREISTDSFDRSWDRQPPHQRELYNPRNADFEPVRRGGPPYGRPSVLQRNMQPGRDQYSPPEPSPAFQSHTVSHRQMGPPHAYRDDFRRRRTSSNVSGGSGSFARRPSFNDNASHVGSIHDSHAGRPDASLPPTPVLTNTVPAPASVAGSVDAPVPSVTEVLAQQEKIMKERALEAKRRRMEQEAAEEAAKKERLRLKIEALERAEAEKKAKEQKEREEREKAEAEAKAKKEAEEEAKRQEEKLAQEKAAQEAAEMERAAAAAKPAPYRPPQLQNAAQQDRQSQYQGSQSGYAGSQQQPRYGGAWSNQSDANRSFNQPSQSQPEGLAAPAAQEPWKSVPSAQVRYTKWGPPSHPPSHTAAQTGPANPWGPVGERPRFVDHTMPSSRYPQQAPANINYGISSSQQSDPSYPQHAAQPPLSPSRRPPPSPAQQAGFQHRQSHSSNQPPQWGSHASTSSYGQSLEDPSRLPPAESGAQPWRRTSVGSQPTLSQPQQHMTMDRDGAASGTFNGIQQQPYVSYSNYQQPPVSSQAPSAPMQTRAMSSAPASNRASRFFPTTSTEQAPPLSAQNPPLQTEESPLMRLRECASPPPPICPVEPEPGEDVSPVVHLPKVSLPGSTHARSPPHVRNTSTGSAPRENPRSPRAASGIDAFEAVQNRIKAKLQESHTHPNPSPVSPTARFVKPTSPHVAPTSKTALSDASTSARANAVVSLPKSPYISEAKLAHGSDAHTLTTDPFTRPTEEDLFSELFAQVFGSQPLVRIPHQAPPALYNPAPAPPTPRPNKMRVRLQPQSIDAFSIVSAKDFQNQEGGRFIPVLLPGQSMENRKEIPFTGTYGSGKKRNYQRKPRGNGNGNGEGRGGHGGYNRPVTYSRHGNGMGMGMAGARRVADPVQ